MKKNIWALSLVNKIPLKLAIPTHAYYTVYFKLRVLSVFPSCSNISTHFHIETPSNILYCYAVHNETPHRAVQKSIAKTKSSNRAHLGNLKLLIMRQDVLT